MHTFSHYYQLYCRIIKSNSTFHISLQTVIWPETDREISVQFSPVINILPKLVKPDCNRTRPNRGKTTVIHSSHRFDTAGYIKLDGAKVMATKKKNCHGVSHPHVSNITITKGVGITSELKYKPLIFVDTLYSLYGFWRNSPAFDCVWTRCLPPLLFHQKEHDTTYGVRLWLDKS